MVPWAYQKKLAGYAPGISFTLLVVEVLACEASAKGKGKEGSGEREAKKAKYGKGGLGSRKGKGVLAIKAR